MIIVKVWGGIGNQLFQYVFGQYLHYKTGQIVYYDDSSYVSNDKLRNSELRGLDTDILFNNDCLFSMYRGIKNRLLRLLFQLNPRHHFIQEFKDEIPEVFNTSHIYFFQGYWQDVKNYKWLKENVSGFELRAKTIPEELKNIESSIIGDKESVSLHVRRGDYFAPQNVGIYGVCDASYYEKALSQISQGNKDMEIYVFSDDIEWVQENIHLPQPYHIVPNYDVPQFVYIELMSKCKHHIISNSSFSWWGAVINHNNDSVVLCPSVWRKDTNDSPALSNWERIQIG